MLKKYNEELWMQPSDRASFLQGAWVQCPSSLTCSALYVSTEGRLALLFLSLAQRYQLAVQVMFHTKLPLRIPAQ